MVAYLVGYYFGLRAYATVYAVGSAIFTLGVSLGPFTVAALVDLTGTYTYGICSAAALVLLGALGVVFLPRQRHEHDTLGEYNPKTAGP
jgi:MFS-type transporter involved in bile tolerance (Atg22 family)